MRWTVTAGTMTTAQKTLDTTITYTIPKFQAAPAKTPLKERYAQGKQDIAHIRQGSVQTVAAIPEKMLYQRCNHRRADPGRSHVGTPRSKVHGNGTVTQRMSPTATVLYHSAGLQKGAVSITRKPRSHPQSTEYRRAKCFNTATRMLTRM